MRAESSSPSSPWRPSVPIVRGDVRVSSCARGSIVRGGDRTGKELFPDLVFDLRAARAQKGGFLRRGIAARKCQRRRCKTRPPGIERFVGGDVRMHQSSDDVALIRLLLDCCLSMHSGLHWTACFLRIHSERVVREIRSSLVIPNLLESLVINIWGHLLD